MGQSFTYEDLDDIENALVNFKNNYYKKSILETILYYLKEYKIIS